MKKIDLRGHCLFSFFTCLVSFFSAAQTDSIEILNFLPDDLKETSGIAKSSNADEYWSHNNRFLDGDPFVLGDIHLFESTTGNIVKTVKINQNDIIGNSDMEDMTWDDSDNLYIGDTGIGDGSKTNFRIYKVNAIDAYVNGATVVSELINFTYPNNVSYNAEAFFWHDNYIYLFTKGFANDTLTVTFRIPDSAGSHTAEFLETVINSSFSPAITSAAINDSENTIALLAYQKCLLIRCFEAPYFFTNSEFHLKTFNGPQTLNTNFRSEAVTFIDEFNLIGTNEFKNSPPVTQSVFKFNMNDFIQDNFLCLSEKCGLIENYNFNDGLNDWIGTNEAAQTSNVNFSNTNNSVKISMDNGGTAYWNVRLKQEYFDTEIAETYNVSFTASSNFDRAIQMLIGQKINGIYSGYLFRNVDLSTNDTYYEYTFTTTEPSNSFSRITFDCGNENLSEVYLDDICIEKLDCPFYVFVDDSISTAHYKAESVLESRGQIKENADVTFSADFIVNLKIDFEVKASSNFEAYIDDCN